VVTDGVSTNIAVLVVIQGNNVYALQPRKRGQPKISFHESGQRHAKIDRGKAQLVYHGLPPQLVEGQAWLFSISFENFASLLPFHGQHYDVVETIDLRTFSANTLPYVEIATGQNFLTRPEIHEPDYVERLVSEKILRDKVPRVCIRVKVLEQP
jgi:hypothetical protein